MVSRRNFLGASAKGLGAVTAAASAAAVSKVAKLLWLPAEPPAMAWRTISSFSGGSARAARRAER